MARSRYRNNAGLSGRKFFRVRDKAWISGVCAGIAHYFGFRLGITRLLAVLSLMFLGPVTILVYIGVVLLIPSRCLPAEYADPADREFNQAIRARPRATIGDVRRRYQHIEARLARLERHVTSPRFDLDREISNL